LKGENDPNKVGAMTGRPGKPRERKPSQEKPVDVGVAETAGRSTVVCQDKAGTNANVIGDVCEIGNLSFGRRHE